MRRRRAGVAVVALLALGALTACSGGAKRATAHLTESQGQITATLRADQPCGTATKHPPRYEHVVWIWMENKRFDEVIGDKGAPFENAIAKACGLAANFNGVTHPSLPNYLAATGGSTFGVTDDDDPVDHPIDAPSIFSQIDTAGLTWRAYQGAMPSPCDATSTGLYGAKHNPPAYYVPLRSSCEKNDVPFDPAFAHDVGAGTLPSLSFVTPNLCNDTHNDECAVPTGDSWLTTWVQRLVSGPNYRAGNTVVVVTWDESHADDPTNHIPTIVIAPSVPRGTVVQERLDHYSLLRMTEDILGLPPLGNAAKAPGMRAAFHLGAA